MADAIDRAAQEIAALTGDTGAALRDLTRAQKHLTRTVLLRSRRGADPENEEDEDEIDDEQEDEEDLRDEEEDEDQDPDDPDDDTGIDDLRGTAGAPKRTRKSRRVRRSRKEEDAEERLARARARLRKAERDEDEAEDDHDDDRLEEARKSREKAEHELERARRHVKKVHEDLERARHNDTPEDRPAWAGDETEFRGDRRRRRRTADEWYSDSEDAYFTNEDADHEEDGTYPPDGPDVADGDDEDQYTIGAHKVRSERAVRRSRRGVPGRQDLFRAVGARGRVTEDLLDAAPALEEVLEIMGTHQDTLAKSVRHLQRQDATVAALAQAVHAQGKVLGALTKSFAAYLAQPQVAAMSGFPQQLGVITGGRQRRGDQKLQKSRQDLLVEAERGLQSGVLDATTFQTLGYQATPEAIVAAVSPDQARALGWAQ